MVLSLASLFFELKSVFKSQGGTLRNVVMILLVFGLQAIVAGEGLFKCPSVNYSPYATMFIIAPGLLLFLVSLFLNDNFWKIVRGCCYYEDFEVAQDRKKRCLPCCFPRWGCSKKLLEVIFYSLIATCLWIFWAFLKKEYYVCAKLGDKKAKLVNATAEKIKQVEEDYQRAADSSQVIAFVLLGVMLFLPFVFLTMYRCCCKPPISKIPSPYQYTKLEADAAVERFKEQMEQLAKEQGKRKAEMYFAEQTLSDKNPFGILVKAYEDLNKIEKYSDAFPALEEYKSMEANAAVTAFKTHVENAGKERVAVTFVDKTWSDFEKKDPFGLVENVYDSIADRYPRMTGDRSQPYIKMDSELTQPKPKIVRKEKGKKSLPDFEIRDEDL